MNLNDTVCSCHILDPFSVYKMVWLQFMKEQKTHLTFRLGMGALSIAGENHSRNTQKTKQFIIKWNRHL